MEYRLLGRSGVRVSSLTLGGDHYGDMTSEETSRRILQVAIDAGINLMDTGNSYCGGESERITMDEGRMIEEAKADHFFISPQHERTRQLFSKILQ